VTFMNPLIPRLHETKAIWTSQAAVKSSNVSLQHAVSHVLCKILGSHSGRFECCLVVEYVNGRCGGTCHFHLQGRISAEQEVQ
jgi:hypothetical protein